MNSPLPLPAQLEQLHQTYCRLTGQNLSWRFDRERLWWEFLHAGFTLADLTQVIRYLQKEIRHTRRNVGALKLSNLLQLDRLKRISTLAGSVSFQSRRQSRRSRWLRLLLRPNKSGVGNAPWNNCANSNKPSANQPMPLELSVLEKLEIAHRLVAEALGQTPQLYDCRLDQALLVLELSIKRAHRSPHMRLRLPPDHREEQFLF